jgi:TrmH family RNA methyltransferase
VQEGVGIGRVRLRRLARLGSRKVRLEMGLQLIEGRRLVDEALRAGRVSEIFTLTDLAPHWQVRAGPRVLVHPLPEMELERLADVTTPQDVIAVGPLPPCPEVEDLLPIADRILLLDGVQDPGNVGTLARTALALGIQGLALARGTADVTAPKVLRASAGALFRLALARVERTSALAAMLPTFGHRLVLPVVRGGMDFRRVPPPRRFVLVAGNEGAGTSLDGDDPLRITIPMVGETESLNVAAAVAAILARWL